MQFFTNALSVLAVRNVITGSSSRTDTIVVLNELFRYNMCVWLEKKNNNKNKKCRYTAAAISSLFITRKHRNEKRNNK